MMLRRVFSTIAMPPPAYRDGGPDRFVMVTRPTSEARRGKESVNHKYVRPERTTSSACSRAPFRHTPHKLFSYADDPALVEISTG